MRVKREERQTYTLHPKPAAPIHHLEELLILLAPEEIQPGNLKVGPEMAHVVALALHGLRVHVWDARLALVVRLDVRVLALGLDKHLPQALGLEALEPLVGRRVAENVGHRLAEFFDDDGEAVGLVVLDHFEEGVATREC
jgi:hypothetical protein